MTPYPYQWGAILRNYFTTCAEDAREGYRRNAPGGPRPQARPEHPLQQLWDLLAEDGPKSPEQLARIHRAATREAA